MAGRGPSIAIASAQERSRIRVSPRIEKRLSDAEPQDAWVTMLVRNLLDVSAGLVERPLLDQPDGLARLLAANPVVETEIRERHQRGDRHGTGWDQ